MGNPSDAPVTTPREAAAALATLAAHREALADQAPRRPRWYAPTMGLLLGASIAIGALHDPVISVLALPFTLYAFVGLTGIDDWHRVGVAPRRPHGLAAAGVASYLLGILPLVWGGAVLLNRSGRHWALPAAGIVGPLLVVTGRRWLSRLQRRRLLGR